MKKILIFVLALIIAAATLCSCVVEKTCDHEFNAGIVTVEPTDYNGGKMTYTCIHCGEAFDFYMSALGPVETTVNEAEWREMFLADNFSMLATNGEEIAAMMVDDGILGVGTTVGVVSGELVPQISTYIYMEGGEQRYIQKENGVYYEGEGDTDFQYVTNLSELFYGVFEGVELEDMYSNFTYDSAIGGYVGVYNEVIVEIHAENAKLVRACIHIGEGVDFTSIDVYLYDYGTTSVTLPTDIVKSQVTEEEWNNAMQCTNFTVRYTDNEEGVERYTKVTERGMEMGRLETDSYGNMTFIIEKCYSASTQMWYYPAYSINPVGAKMNEEVDLTLGGFLLGLSMFDGYTELTYDDFCYVDSHRGYKIASDTWGDNLVFFRNGQIVEIGSWKHSIYDVYDYYFFDYGTTYISMLDGVSQP